MRTCAKFDIFFYKGTRRINQSITNTSRPRRNVENSNFYFRARTKMSQVTNGPPQNIFLGGGDGGGLNINVSASNIFSGSWLLSNCLKCMCARVGAQTAYGCDEVCAAGAHQNAVSSHRDGTVPPYRPGRVAPSALPDTRYHRRSENVKSGWVLGTGGLGNPGVWGRSPPETRYMQTMHVFLGWILIMQFSEHRIRDINLAKKLLCHAYLLYILLCKGGLLSDAVLFV